MSCWNFFLIMHSHGATQSKDWRVPCCGRNLRPLNVHIIWQSCSLTCNRTARISYQCRKTNVISCHRCLINTGVEEKNIYIYDKNISQLKASSHENKMCQDNNKIVAKILKMRIFLIFSFFTVVICVHLGPKARVFFFLAGLSSLV